ncbi:MAG: ABC transporter ATP-binding protein [Candidatus Cloacimonetes bacterium]|nr:ABC transporter ATP-binding protein [Candidatus Cloacimonadota bacterium]
MKNVLKIYKFVLQYPYDITMGLISLILFSAFSGISITLVIPVFDQIFTVRDAGYVKYKVFNEFYEAVKSHFYSIWQNSSFTFSVSYFDPYWKELRLLMGQADPYMLLWVICVLLVGLFLLKNIFYILNRIFFVNLRGKSINAIRNYCYKKYLSQSYSFFNQNRVGDSIVRMVNDIDIVNNYFIDNALKIVRELFSIFIFAFIAIRLNPKLFLFSILFLPGFTFGVNFISRKIKKYAKKIQNELSNMFSNIEEVLNSMRIVKAFCREDYEYQKLVVINRKFFKFWRKSQVYWSFGVPLGEISTVITGIAILIVGAQSILNRQSDFSFGDFTAFLFAVFSMLHPLKAVTNSITDIKKAMVSVDRVAEILDLSSEIIEADSPIEKTTFNEKIVFKNVSFSYNENQQILKNVNFEIKKGEKVAFVGASGSGKTTIANLINRMYDPTNGEILMDGINLKKLSIRHLRKMFGIVTQESILFSDSVENNVKYGAFEDVGHEKVLEACQFAYADEFIETLPDKYNSMILPHGYNFSGGQRQRICIARAIVDDPDILIFDEATSALDTDSEKKVQNAIDQAAGNRTVVLIAHRLSTILSADKIFVLEQGQLVGSGNHDELLSNCPQYRHFYNLQFKHD